LSSLAKRYVQPLFEVARDANVLDQVAADLQGLDSALSGSTDLRVFLASPTALRATKRSVLEAVLAGASPFTINFVRLVVNKNRTEILHLASRIYADLLNIHRGIIPGSVETAVAMDDAAFGLLEKAVAERFHAKVVLSRKVDPGLIAGVRVRVGNRVVDATVKGQLEKLRTALAGE